VPEVCNGLDDDCNGQIDNGVLQTWVYDGDGDGHGSKTMPACSSPGANWKQGIPADDCDDNDPKNYPGNAEVCDGRDNNCNNQIDEGLGQTWVYDNDGDGHGSQTTSACSSPGAGWHTGIPADDCNDNDGAIFPGNPEVCDGKDNNCNGQIDEGDTCPTIVLETKREKFTAGLGGVSSDPTFGNGTCSYNGLLYSRVQCTMVANNAGCHVNGWVSTDPNNCTCSYHVGAPALWGVDCTFQITGKQRF
jgi:hypothetical protein